MSKVTTTSNNQIKVFLFTSLLALIFATESLQATQILEENTQVTKSSIAPNRVYHHEEIFPDVYVVKNGDFTLAIKRETHFADRLGTTPFKIVYPDVYEIPENATRLNEIYFSFKNRNNGESYFFSDQIKFIKGIAYHNNQIVTEIVGSGERQKYVMDVNGHLYISNEQTFSHATLLNGAYCLCAGILSFNEQGKVTYIANGSGHIKPSQEQFYAACKYLDYIEALSPNCTVKIYQQDIGSHTETYEEFAEFTYEGFMNWTLPPYDYENANYVEGEFGIAKVVWDAQKLAPKKLLPEQPLKEYAWI